MNPNGTMNVFNLSALQMSRSVSGSGSGSDYHMSDEEASVGTQRDFIWGVIMGYFLGMYCTCCVVIYCALLYCTDCTEWAICINVKLNNVNINELSSNFVLIFLFIILHFDVIVHSLLSYSISIFSYLNAWIFV